MADADAPDPAEATTTDRGQPVVRVRKRKKNPDGTRTIDDVVRKHLDREPSAPLASAPAYHHPDAAVPPDEDDPAKRDRPTISEITLTPEAFGDDEELPPDVEEAAAAEAALEIPDLSDGKYRGLEDLNAVFPFDGSGQYFVAVTRIQPKIHAGVACYGRQQNIRDRLSYSSFCNTYGGGSYELIVYGPPKRGKMLDKLGQVVPKALTKAIRFDVPYMGAGGRDPNPMSAFEEEESMQELPGGRRGPFERELNLPDALLSRRGNTMPEANMYKEHLEHQRIMNDREREDRKEAKAAREQGERSLLEVVADTKDQTIQMLRDELDEVKREQKNGHSKNGTDMAGLAQVLSSVRGPQASSEEIDRIRALHETQLQDLRQTHASRVADLEERHRRERDDITARLSREKDDAVRRADSEVERASLRMGELERRLTHERDQERASAQREAERMQTAHDRAVEALGREHQRDIESVRSNYEARIGGLNDRMASEARLLQQVHESTKQVEKTTVEAQLKSAESENRRLEAELARVRAELEKKGNLPKLLDEATKTAEALGFVKDDGGQAGAEDVDMKTLGMRALVTLAQNLPEVIKQAGQAATAVRDARAGGGGGGAPRLAPGPGQFPPMMAPPPGRPPVTHGGPIGGWIPEGSGIEPPPLPAAYSQPASPMLPAIAAQPAPSMPPLGAAAPMQPVAQQQHPTMHPTTPPQQPAFQPTGPVQSSPPPSMPPPATQAAPELLIPEEEIVKFAPDLEQFFQAAVQGASVSDLAARIIAAEPRIKFVAPGLTAERIVDALQKAGKSDSPLVRRDGQRFLRQFRDAILQAS